MCTIYIFAIVLLLDWMIEWTQGSLFLCIYMLVLTCKRTSKARCACLARWGLFLFVFYLFFLFIYCFFQTLVVVFFLRVSVFICTHTYTWSRLAHQNSRSRLFAASPHTCHRSSKNKSSISNMSCCNIINGSHSSSKNIVLISLSIDILHIYIQRI